MESIPLNPENEMPKLESDSQNIDLELDAHEELVKTIIKGKAAEVSEVLQHINLTDDEVEMLFEEKYSEKLDEIQQISSDEQVKSNHVLRFRKETRKKLITELNYWKKKAVNDDLVSAYRKTHFLDLGAEFIAKAQQEQSSLASLRIDLNNFKEINDTYGHHVGDEFLKKVGNVISELLPKGALFGKMGGDEFSILIPDATLVDAATLKEEINTAFKSEFILHNQDKIFLREASIGIIAGIPKPDVDIPNTYFDEFADLYQLKDKEKHRITGGKRRSDTL